MGGSVYEGVPVFVTLTCMVAATTGLMFGYDHGISGGVSLTKEFLVKFFPSVYKKMMEERDDKNAYCTFDSHLLTLYTSSLYLAAFMASIYASTITAKSGPKTTMFFGGLVYLLGSILNGIANSIIVLIVGRLLLGVGIGFVSQSAPVYISEMAPANLRGALNTGFHMAITIGILMANLVNYGSRVMEKELNWRVSLAGAAFPAIMITLGVSYLLETPNSELERGNKEKAKQILRRIRSDTDANNIEDEFCQIVAAANKSEHHCTWKKIFERKHRPQLLICTLVPFFQQFTGINVAMLYAPVMFLAIGYGLDTSLVSAVIIGAVHILATIAAIVTVDKFGRRILLIAGGIQMIISQVGMGVIVALKFGIDGTGILTVTEVTIVLFFICAHVAAFAWSWGPLCWLLPSEICPLEIRSAGQAISVSVNMLFSFLAAQLFRTMLCQMKFTLFFFFASFVVVMTVLVGVFLPETKNVPIEEMSRVWKEHWFWSKYMIPHHDSTQQDP